MASHDGHRNGVLTEDVNLFSVTATPRTTHGHPSPQDDAGDYEVIAAYVMDDDASPVPAAEHEAHSGGPPSIKVRSLSLYS